MSSPTLFWLFSVVLLLAGLYLGKVPGILVYVLGMILAVTYCHLQIPQIGMAFILNTSLTLASIYVGQWRGFGLHLMGSLALIGLLVVV